MSEEIVAAINDLTRVTIALNGGFASKSEGIRRLHELSIPSGRIAALLGMKQSDVGSVITKLKKTRRHGGANGG